LVSQFLDIYMILYDLLKFSSELQMKSYFYFPQKGKTDFGSTRPMRRNALARRPIGDARPMRGGDPWRGGLHALAHIQKCP